MSKKQNSKVTSQIQFLDALTHAIRMRPRFGDRVNDIAMVGGGFDWFAYLAVGEAFERGVDRASAVRVLINVTRSLAGDKPSATLSRLLDEAESLLRGESKVSSSYEVLGMIAEHRAGVHGGEWSLDAAGAEVLHAADWFTRIGANEDPSVIREVCEHAAWWIVRIQHERLLNNDEDGCYRMKNGRFAKDHDAAREAAQRVAMAIRADFEALPGGCETWKQSQAAE